MLLSRFAARCRHVYAMLLLLLLRRHADADATLMMPSYYATLLPFDTPPLPMLMLTPFRRLSLSMLPFRRYAMMPLDTPELITRYAILRCC